MIFYDMQTDVEVPRYCISFETIDCFGMQPTVELASGFLRKPQTE